jgi:hypothetical protein
MGMACEDYEEKEKLQDGTNKKNWAQKERDYANEHFDGDKQQIGLIDLGGLPKPLTEKEKVFCRRIIEEGCWSVLFKKKRTRITF